MNCLRDVIGIQWCGGDTAPASGFYINSMAGITIKMMEKLTVDEANTFALVWDNIQGRAIRRFQLAIQNEFQKRYRIANIQKSYDLEKDIDTTTVTAAAAQWRGIYVDDNYFIEDNIMKFSALQNHWVQTLYFYSPIVQANSVIRIFDFDLNTTLDTFTQNFVIGWNTIQVNRSYTAYKLFIGVDSTNFNSVDKLIPPSTQLFPVNVRGGSFTIGANISTLVIGDNTFGLSGIFSVKCKYDSIICNNLDLFSTPFSYVCASELMLERLASNRWNFITTSTKQAEEMKAYYDAEAEKAITLACNGIDLDMNDICLDCNEGLQVKDAPFYFRYNDIHYYN